MKTGPNIVAVCVLTTLFAANAAHGQIPEAPAIAPRATPGPDPLTLSCVETRAGVKTDAFTAYRASPDARAPGRGFDDQIEAQLFSGQDRIRLPRAIMRDGEGENAWFKLKKVAATEREITGRVGAGLVNMLSAPQVHIDRIAGTIEISGESGTFAGVCTKTDPASQSAKF
jgi:hypothetical protein